MSDKKLSHESKKCWEVYNSQEQRTAIEENAREYIEFLSSCKTERQVVEYAKEKLVAAGFSSDLNADTCYRIQRGKTVFAARKGKRPLSEGFRLVGAHADCPRLDFKQNPLYEDTDLGLAKTHYYGGIRKYQWLARPLAIHGVVVKKDGEVVSISIGDKPEDPVFTVTDLLPHLAYEEVEKKVKDAFDAEKLNVLLGHQPSEGDEDKDESKKKADKAVHDNMLTLLNDSYGIEEADLYSAELEVVPAGPARFVGLDKSMIGGYGQDDRACCFAALKAFLLEPEPEYTQIVLLWDKEEIGSDGSTGAQSKFFEYTLDELVDTWEKGTRLSTVLMNGTALSADVNAGFDPDFKNVHEPKNSAYMGKGPCFNKFTGHRGKVGANDAHPEFVAFLRRILDDAGVPWQMAELGKVDLGGGGTVAKFLARYGMDIIDVGPSVLSMHSPFEVTSTVDMYATVECFRVFLKN
ncbi:MAG: aminopeptidase [Desulfovibrio sp.]